mmetsp:Transcript_34600/g.89704  ORF Transcript_34600/g.89704 Transcript_34600/m.89704 type:complete len:122 (+) Transcript_34600:69-434(+)
MNPFIRMFCCCSLSRRSPACSVTYPARIVQYTSYVTHKYRRVGAVHPSPFFSHTCTCKSSRKKGKLHESGEAQSDAARSSYCLHITASQHPTPTRAIHYWMVEDGQRGQLCCHHYTAMPLT